MKLGSVATVAVVLLAAAGLVMVFDSSMKEDSIAAAIAAWVAVAVAIGVVSLALADGRSARAVIFHPLGMPLAYLVYALLVPFVYISLTGEGIENMPRAMLNVKTVSAMVLTVVAYILGVKIAQIGRVRVSNPPLLPPLPTVREANVSFATRDIGRLILLVALVAQVYVWIAAGDISSRTYGANQLDYNSTVAITVLGESLVAVGCLLVMRGNAYALRRPLAVVDFLLIVVVCGIGLVALGSRAEAIAPPILFLWFWAKSGRRVPVGALMAGAACIAVLFLVIAEFRTGGSDSTQYPPLARLLVETTSPVFVTDNIIRVVPTHHQFLFGSTYLSSLQYMLPGPIGRAIFGGVGGTGSLVYRELTHFTDPGQGWGFSYPTEAYVNYGFVGILVVGVFVGFLFGRSFLWSSASGITNHLGSYLYPLLISYLPFGLRTDALGELKNVIYPLAICAVALLIGRAMVRGDRPAILALGFNQRARGPGTCA